jgi:D-lactate dehydrogenase (cytochrome)
VHEIVAALNGTFSAEHGIGRTKVDLLAKSRPAIELDLMRRVKAALDPAGLMNPGKVLRTG